MLPILAHAALLMASCEGNVGIGTDGPSAKLGVAGDTPGGNLDVTGATGLDGN